MNVYLTLDYEIYFGRKSGTASRCILEPTRELMEIARRTGARMTFFIDTGYLLKLEQFRTENRELDDDHHLITSQIRELVAGGHDCQLHIHPHWEDTVYRQGQWHMDVSRYKLADFSGEDIMRIVTAGSDYLQQLTGKPVTTYRAGGWCLQPFEKVRPAFIANNIRLDSTVFPGGFQHSPEYFYDFRNCPPYDYWRFSNDLCSEDKSGEFCELPISSRVYSPLFFWKLFILGRWKPHLHKPLGDGFPVATPGGKKKLLTGFNLLPVSLDGYFASELVKASRRKGQREMVVIGHPKACTRYSLKTLEKFISTSSDCRFLTLEDFYRDKIC